MKPRPIDKMRDPFYAQLIFLIEQQICEVDKSAQEKGIKLRDSQIQSALIKASAIVAGKNPKVEETTDADLLIKQLIDMIVDSSKSITVETTDEGEVVDESALGSQQWIATIAAVTDSLKRRKSSIAGRRDYLDFVQDFVSNALE